MLKQFVRTLTCLVIFIGSSVVCADELRSRGSLGVIGDSQSNAEGVVIQQVAPNSSASEIGIRAEDVIVEINGVKVNSFAELVNVLSKLRAGDGLNLSVKRENKLLALKGSLKAQPKEQSTEFNVEYSSVDFADNRLRSIIYTPKDFQTDKKHPALYFVQGYTCNSIDWGRVPNLTIRQALSEVTKQGYVVYRIEKFGVGDSIGPKKCSQVDFSTELAGFNQGMKQLKSLPYVDSSSIHIFGHSLGGLYAPLMAQKHEVASIAVYGTVVKSWYEYILDIYSEQAQIFGTDKKVALNNRKTVQPLLHALLKTDRQLEEILSDKALKPAIDAELLPLSGDQFFHRHYTFFRDLNNYDFYDVWSKTSSPVLAIHGEYDIQAINDQWTKDIVESVNQKGKMIAERVILEKTEHALVKYPTREKLLEAMNNRTHSPVNPAEKYSKGIETILVNWLKKHS